MAADEDQNLNDGGGSTLQNTFDPKFEVTSLPKMSLGYSWDYILISKRMPLWWVIKITASLIYVICIFFLWISQNTLYTLDIQ